MSKKILIESLAMDLLRVALGLHRGSYKMAERFSEEAMARYKDLENFSKEDPKLKNLLDKMKSALESEREDKYEDILMYSILVQNFALYRLKV